MQRGRNGGIYHRNPRELDAWRSAVLEAGAGAMFERSRATGPVAVQLVFRLPRPKAHFLPANRSRLEPVLRLDAPAYPMSPPDIDKLARAALDALTSAVFA